jgi:ribosomal protein S18 acetylase RimI-like enzyme
MNKAQSGVLAIRPAESTDADALALLMCELGYETTTEEMQMRLRPILADSPYRTFVAMQGEKICGMIGTVCYHSYEHNDLSGRIIAMVVSKGSRRRGIGRELSAAAEKDFADRKISRAALNTRQAREEAHEFYEKLGYERTGFRFAKKL